MGCALERITFAHYVEQKLNISYRFFKEFDAKTSDNGSVKSFRVRYFVRNLDLNTDLKLDLFEYESFERRKLRVVPFGRFKARSISSRDFLQVARSLIQKNEYALITEEINP